MNQNELVGTKTNQNSLSSSLSRYCLIHEFGDLDMPLAVAQLGQVTLQVRSTWLPCMAELWHGAQSSLVCSMSELGNMLAQFKIGEYKSWCKTQEQ